MQITKHRNNAHLEQHNQLMFSSVGNIIFFGQVAGHY